MELSHRFKPNRGFSKVRSLLGLAALLLGTGARTWAADPTITLGPSPAAIFDGQTSKPFAGITLAADTANVDVTITFNSSEGSFGSYNLSNVSLSAAESTLQNLVFTPSNVPDGTLRTTTFTLQVSDKTTPTALSATKSVNLDVRGNRQPSVSLPPNASSITDKQTSQPFASISITDLDSALGDSVTVTISFPQGRGSFPESAPDFTKATIGANVVYTLSARSASSAQSFLQGLTFTPTENRIPVTPGFDSEVTSFTVTVTDLSQESDSDTENLTVSSVNDKPVLSGSLTGINDNASGAIFLGLTIIDPDVERVGSSVVPQSVTLTATLPSGGGGDGTVLLGTFVGGQTVYTTTGQPSAVNTDLHAVQFTPTPNRLPVGQTESVSVNFLVIDSLAASATADRSFGILSINDPPTAVATLSPSSFSDATAVFPFRLAISDPDPGETFTATLSLVNGSDSQYGTFLPASPSISGTAATVALGVQGISFVPVKDSAAGSQTISVKFHVTDGHGGAVDAPATLTMVGVNDPPNIVGVSSSIIRISDDESVKPFTGVKIDDPDGLGQQTVTVTLALDDPAKGTLTPAGSFASQTPATVSAALQNVTFTPTPNHLPVGESETVVITITVTDSLGLTRSNNKTTIVVTSVNGAPQITGIPSVQPVLISPASPVRPFAAHDSLPAIAVTDDDASAALTLTISIDDPAKGTLSPLSSGGFSEEPSGSGNYKFTGVSASATAALQALEFQTNPNYLFPPNAPGGTTFTIKAVDSVLNTRVATLSIVLQTQARNHLVTRLDDDMGEGSLRHAVAVAGNDDVITFALKDYPAVVQLDQNLGPIELVRNVTIKGPGADLLSISGDADGNSTPDVQLLRISSFVVVEGVTFTKGAAGTGGAIYVGEGGNLSLHYCAVTDSQAAQWGGGIDVDRGSLSMDHCFVAGNSNDIALGLGGGAISLFTDQPCSFVNTTFSANRQLAPNGFGGGAIYVENYTPKVELSVQVVHCTFAENQDAAGNGSSIHANVFGTHIQAKNSIFADGQEKNLGVSGAGRIVSLGGNVSDDSTRTILTQGGQPKLITLLDQASDRTSKTGVLIALNQKWRPTPAYPLAANSPAIGLAVSPAETTDQRGVIRDAHPDSGAVERGATQRLVINELQEKGYPADYIELYVLRDSQPINLGGFTLWVDGVLQRTIPANTIVQPGYGVVMADNANVTTPDAKTPVLLPSSSESPLGLGARANVQLKTPSGGVALNVNYVDVFVDPADPAQNLDFPNNSLTLAPQFRGFAYLPHSIVLGPPLGGGDLNFTGDPTSPGSDTGNTPFGSPNAYPSAIADQVLVGEDDLPTLDVLANDLDADGSDVLVIVDVSTTGGIGGTDASTTSAQGATVTVSPGLPGSLIHYDPSHANILQQLPEGVEKTDEFYYSIIDYGTGQITGFQSGGIASTIVTSQGHRLADNQLIEITGSDVPAYNGQFHVTTKASDPTLSDDTFSIPVAFTSDPANRGSWATVGPRQPSQIKEGQVSITVIGANDPPYIKTTTFSAETDEEKILRIMADPTLAGSTTVQFDTDSLYPTPREISPKNLLSNVDDIDTDDSPSTLKVVGVVGSVNSIASYSGTPGSTPVTVHAPAHGLLDGTRILISGYGGHPSYNGYHDITVVDADTFTIPVIYVRDEPSAAPGVWAILNDDNRLSAISAKGASVTLEIRTLREETSVVYNPRTSASLNALALGESDTDTFYYAVMDSHSAITLAPIKVTVHGVNDAPVPRPDPTSLDLLGSLVGSGRTLPDVLSGLNVLFNVPPDSGLDYRTDVEVQFDDGGQILSFYLTDLWTTDEETSLDIPVADLLANDTDVDIRDTPDVLSINAVCDTSRAGARLTIDGDNIVYNPLPSPTLQRLAREEPFIDSFDITVTDSHGGNVVTTVAVVVVGLNDTPSRRDYAGTTPEDALLEISPSQILGSPEQIEVDINGHPPDNILHIFPIIHVTTPGGADLTIENDTVHYDPRGSEYLDGLAQGQTFVDYYDYTVWDGSFIFANDDLYKVQADGSDYVLDILTNDRNLTGFPGELHISSVGTPSRGGTATVDGTSKQIIYTPQVNFVGDEVIPYAASDDLGNTDGGLVRVRVTVNQLNGNLQANADNFTVAVGQSPVLDVLANDNIIPATGEGLTITRILSQPSPDSVALVANRIIYTQSVTDPNAPHVAPYSTTFEYEISGGGTARAKASVTVRVEDKRGTLSLRPDNYSVQADSTDNPLDVLANDSILPGSPIALTVLAPVSPTPKGGTIKPDPTGTTLLYTPKPGFVGEDTVEYFAVDGFGGTGSTNVTIAVGQLTASSDFFVVPYDSTTAVAFTPLDVLANDRVLQAPGNAPRITLVSPENVSLGAIKVADDGDKLLFDPAKDQQGEQEFTYMIRDNTGRTAQGHVLVIVTDDGVKANPDYFAAGVDTTGNELDVLLNDRAIPDGGRPLTIVSIGTGLNAPNHGGTATVSDNKDRLIYTPAPGFIGEETFTYTMTDSRNTDVAKVVVRVSAGALLAANDAFTVFFNPPPDGQPSQFTLPVLANDRVLPDSGQVLTITGVGITYSLPSPQNAITNAPNKQGTVAISADGATLIYSPGGVDGPFPYEERFTYELSDGTARRASAEVLVKVEKRLGEIEMETNDDAFTVETDSQSNVLHVLANDAVKPAGALGWRITSVTAPNFGGVVVVSGSDIIYTPKPGFVGTEQFIYAVSDGQGGTGQANVKVKVGDLPVCDDIFSAISGSSNNVFDLLANDGIRPATATRFTLVSVGATDQGGTVAKQQGNNGKVFYTPAAHAPNQYPYTEHFSYVVEDDSGLTVTGYAAVSVHLAGSDRSTARLSITVVGVNDPPVITGTVAGQMVYQKSTLHPFAAVTVTEVDDHGQEKLTVTVTLNDATHGFMANLGNFAPVTGSPGTYRAVNVTAAQATTDLRNLYFVPTTGNRVTPTSPETTRLTLSVKDPFAPAVIDSATTVIAKHAFVTDLTGLDVGLPSDVFGQPVAVSGDLLAIGAATDKHGTSHPTGSIYLYGRNVGGSDKWGLITMIVAPDGADDDKFGFSLALAADTLIAGTPGKNPGVRSGAAYVYERDIGGPNKWGFLQRLTPSVPAKDDEFGNAVSLSGDVLAIGANKRDANGADSGAVYIFKRNAGPPHSWTEVKSFTDGAKGDRFGFSVALDGDTLIAGTPYADDKGTDSGAASIFKRNQPSADQWGRVARLVLTDGKAGDYFGTAVGLQGGLAAVGAPNRAKGSKAAAGAVYIFTRDTSGNWPAAPSANISPADVDIGDLFGSAVAMDGQLLVVGSRKDDDALTDAGSAYIFGRDYNPADITSPIPNNWAQIEKFLPKNARKAAHFGFSVSISRNTVAVGSDFDGGYPVDTTYLYYLKYNNPPEITAPIIDQSVIAGQSLSFVLPADTFVDGDLANMLPLLPDVLVLTATLVDGSPLPSWLTFNPATRTFTALPTAADVGSISIKVTATDLDAGMISDVFSTTVNQTALVRLRIFSAESNGQPTYAATYNGEDLDAYAFGSDAVSSALSPLDLTVVESATGFHRLLAFTRRVGDPRLSYVIEASSDLVSWHLAGTSYEEMSAHAIDPTFERVIFYGSSALDSTPAIEFLRVRVVFK